MKTSELCAKLRSQITEYNREIKEIRTNLKERLEQYSREQLLVFRRRKKLLLDLREHAQRELDIINPNNE